MGNDGQHLQYTDYSVKQFNADDFYHKIGPRRAYEFSPSFANRHELLFAVVLLSGNAIDGGGYRKI
jgi:hypothetical protein